MSVNRGDVVVVDFPFPDATGSKVRPALVVQSDRNNARIAKTPAALMLAVDDCPKAALDLP